MTEYFDVIDSKDNVVGKATRDECHSKGLLHRGVYIFIFNSKGQLFIHKRSTKKDLYKCLWDGSVAGHVESGSGYEKTAERELEEEIGIKTNLWLLSKFRSGEGSDREIDSLFVGFHDGPFRINRSEISKWKFVSVDKLKSMVRKSPRIISKGVINALKEYEKKVKKIHDTATVIIERDGKYLLIKRARKPNIGRWESPGGHVDKGETPKQTAEREMKEEIGDVRIGKEICMILHTVEPGHYHKCHAFRGFLRGDVEINYESADFRWFTRKEMGKLNVAEFTLRIIDDYL